MKKETKKKATKKRGRPEDKVFFSGSFEDMVNISTTGAGAKKPTTKKKSK